MEDYQNTEIVMPEMKEPEPQQPAYQGQNNYQPYANNQRLGPYPQQNYAVQNGYQPPYNYPPNQYTPQYQNYNQTSGNGKATASLVLGIISLVLSWIVFANILSIICGIIGIVLGAGARKELTPQGGRGITTAGMVCSIIALVLSVLILACLTIFGIFTASYDYGFGSSFKM